MSCFNYVAYKMNDIINKFLLAGDKLMMYLDVLIVHVDHLLKINKEFKDLWRHETQIIFTGMNWIEVVFNMIWHMEISKI